MHRKKRKFLSGLLVFVLVLQLMPILALHAVPVGSVWVGGIDVTTADPSTFPTGVSFDSSSRTLTLDNANINSGFLPGGTDTFAGILSLDGNLTIQLMGTNYVDVSSSISGEKVAGVCLFNGNLTLSGAGQLYVRGANSTTPAAGRSFQVDGTITVPNSAQIQYFGPYSAVSVLTDSGTGTFTAGTSFPSPGPGPGPGPSEPALWVNGVDFLVEANRATVPNVTVESYSDTAVTLRLNNAALNAFYANGEQRYGIYASEKNVTIILENDNEIHIPAQSGKRDTGIYVNNGNLNIQGTGTLNVYGTEQSISVIGNDDTQFVMESSAAVTAYGEVRVDPFNSPNVKIWLKDTSLLQNYGTDITGMSILQVEQNARYNPLNFEIDGQAYSIPKTGYSEGETVVESGTGWSVVALGERNPDTGQVDCNFNLNLNNYSGGTIVCSNFFGFLNIGGNNTVSKDGNGFSIYLNNSSPQIWEINNPGQPQMSSLINLEGGIELYYGSVACWYAANWNIGTALSPSPKGIEGKAGQNRVEITRNTFQIYTSSNIAKNIDRLLVEDAGSLIGTTTTKPFNGVGEIVAATSGKYDIAYNDGGAKVIEDASLIQSSFFYRSANPSSTDPFPVAKKYRINCANNTFLSVQDDNFSPEDNSIAGNSILAQDQNYTITDSGTRYLFESTAPKVIRVFGDEDNTMPGGTLEVMSINGYNFGGYVAEVGSEVYVRVLPYPGYQYKTGTLLGSDGLVITPTDQVGVYKFIMPEVNNLGIALSCEFETSNNMLSMDSSLLAATSYTVPSGVITMGNARLTIGDRVPLNNERTAIQRAANGYQTGAVLDLKFDQIVTKDGSQTNVWSNSLSELSNSLTIAMTLKGSLLGHRSYSIARIHNGVTQIIPATLVNGVLTFQTDRFSTYAILYSDQLSPETGEFHGMLGWIGMMLISGGMLIILGWELKKKEC